MDSKFEVSKKMNQHSPAGLHSLSGKSGMSSLCSMNAYEDARVRLWKFMSEDSELTWLKDARTSAVSRIVEMTLQRMRENRAREEAWRWFFSERLGV
jgi:hypothetical protein